MKEPCWKIEVLETAKTCSAAAASALSLLWPAFYNGFPLAYWDTGTYLSTSFTREVPIDRPIFYGLFLAVSRKLSHLLTGAQAGPLWTAAALQAGLLTLLVWLLAATSPARKRTLFLAGMGALALLTGAPWFASQLMPDIFTGTLALAVFLVVFRWDRTTPAVRGLLCSICVMSVVVHLSHLAILGCLLAALSAAGLFGLLRLDRARKNGLLAAWACWVLACVSIAGVNRSLTGKAFISRGSHCFLVGRLIDSGLIGRLLDDGCDAEKYALCPYRDYLRTHGGNEYLWDEDSPLTKTGGWEGSRAESWRMIKAAVGHYPFMAAGSALKSVAVLLANFQIGHGLQEPYAVEHFLFRQLRERHPGAFDGFMASRQQTARLWGAVRAWDRVYVTAAFGALLALFFWRFRHTGSAGDPLGGFVLAFMASNALVCATLSNPFPRYQARVVWLAALAVVFKLFEDRARAD